MTRRALLAAPTAGRRAQWHALTVGDTGQLQPICPARNREFAFAKAKPIGEVGWFQQCGATGCREAYAQESRGACTHQAGTRER